LASISVMTMLRFEEDGPGSGRRPALIKRRSTDADWENVSMMSTVDPQELFQIIALDHPDPPSVLGPHAFTRDGRSHLSIRAYLPDAAEAFVVESRNGHEERHRMHLLHPNGFFECVIEDRDAPIRYELERIDEFGHIERFKDSFSFSPSLTAFDRHLWGEGRNYRIFEHLGAHIIDHEGERGVRFAVWAPEARSVSVIGAFNRWDRRIHPMRRLPGGIWEIFIPGLPEGVLYKFQIKTHREIILDKADPFALRAQKPPETASIVHSLDHYHWHDDDWMADRAQRTCREGPISIYEVHLGSWNRAPGAGPEEDRPLTYAELSRTLVPYVEEMGYTHVQFMPVMHHPFAGSWGYQVTGYYAPNAAWGSPEELKMLIDAFHQRGIGVILDWVPAHFPKDIHSLGRFDGTALYEHLDPRQGEHRDWGTYIFNYGRNEVRNFLIGSALFWLEEYHADGLRVDAITSMLYLNYSRPDGEWIPNEFGGPENLEAIAFLHELNRAVHERCPGAIVIAEESTSWPGVTRPEHLGGLGFDFKWNMGWMHDILEYLSMDPIHRRFHHNKLTFSIWYSFNEAFILPLSHDEVVHLKKSLLLKMPGDAWKKFANNRLLFGFQYFHPGKKLLFMGGEIGQVREWHHDLSVDWHLLESPYHSALQTFVRDLNKLYRREPALWEYDHTSKGFEWIDLADAERSIIAFIRKGSRPYHTLLIVFNFTPVPREDYRVGVTEEGYWEELLNSDSEYYGGSNVGNDGGVHSEAIPWHSRAHSLPLRLPPLGLLVLKRRTTTEERKAIDAALDSALGDPTPPPPPLEDKRPGKKEPDDPPRAPETVPEHERSGVSNGASDKTQDDGKGPRDGSDALESKHEPRPPAETADVRENASETSPRPPPRRASKTRSTAKEAPKRKRAGTRTRKASSSKPKRAAGESTQARPSKVSRNEGTRNERAGSGKTKEDGMRDTPSRDSSSKEQSRTKKSPKG